MKRIMVISMVLFVCMFSTCVWLNEVGNDKTTGSRAWWRARIQQEHELKDGYTRVLCQYHGYDCDGTFDEGEIVKILMEKGL